MSTKLAIIINEQRLRQLMLEFLRQHGPGRENLMYELKFSEFMLWLQRKQRGEANEKSVNRDNPTSAGNGSVRTKQPEH